MSIDLIPKEITIHSLSFLQKELNSVQLVSKKIQEYSSEASKNRFFSQLKNLFPTSEAKVEEIADKVKSLYDFPNTTTGNAQTIGFYAIVGPKMVEICMRAKKFFGFDDDVALTHLEKTLIVIPQIPDIRKEVKQTETIYRDVIKKHEELCKTISAATPNPWKMKKFEYAVKGFIHPEIQTFSMDIEIYDLPTLEERLNGSNMYIHLEKPDNITYHVALCCLHNLHPFTYFTIKNLRQSIVHYLLEEKNEKYNQIVELLLDSATPAEFNTFYDKSFTFTPYFSMLSIGTKPPLLHYAIKTGNTTFAKKLVEKGADVNLQFLDKSNGSIGEWVDPPLSYVSTKNLEEFKAGIDVLRSSGKLDLNMIYIAGFGSNTLLGHLLGFGHNEEAQYLLSLGADPNAGNGAMYDLFLDANFSNDQIEDFLKMYHLLKEKGAKLVVNDTDAFIILVKQIRPFNRWVFGEEGKKNYLKCIQTVLKDNPGYVATIIETLKKAGETGLLELFMKQQKESSQGNPSKKSKLE
ncbi:MAG: hypothetical protein L0207_05130 [Chlamydiae bacterium]|nr:hypothetical protein [Chlamydiota bacterium]